MGPKTCTKIKYSYKLTKRKFDTREEENNKGRYKHTTK